MRRKSAERKLASGLSKDTNTLVLVSWYQRFVTDTLLGLVLADRQNQHTLHFCTYELIVRSVCS